MTDNSMPGATKASAEETGKVRVWDPLVRVFHWGLVAAFATAWLTADELQPLHEIAGYTVAGLVAFRLIWGLVGGRHARFAQFLKGPGETLAYLGDMGRGRERRYLGHNPAGAAMIVALLVTLSGTAFTGWLMEDETRLAMLPAMPSIVSPAWADDDGDEREYGGRGEVEGPLKGVHETLANLMLLLAALHVGGVVLASFRHHENLARAMVTGDKRSWSRRHRLTAPYPRPTVPSALPGLALTGGTFFLSGDLLLPDGKLKRESPTRQEALRSRLHLGLSKPEETLP